MVTVVIIIAVILMLATIGGVGRAMSQTGSFKGARYRQNLYDGVVKPEARRLHETKQRARDESVVATIRAHWQRAIDQHEKRQARDTRRVARRIARGKDPSRIIQRSIRRDSSPSNPAKLRDRELTVITTIHRKAKAGNPRAQRLAGRVHPQTGHTVGGISGIGHIRPAQHMPKVRTPKKTKKKQTGKSIGEILFGKPKPRGRRR